MDRTREYNTMWSKLDQERQTTYDTTYICNLKYYKWTCYKTESDLTEYEFMVTKGEKRGW